MGDEREDVVAVRLDEAARQVARLAVAAVDCEFGRRRLAAERAIDIYQQVLDEARSMLRRLGGGPGTVAAVG
jgi:hypothetical protein